MSITVFSSTGCIRCAIVKQYLKENNLSYDEYDIKTDEGNNKFKAFYRERRSEVKRDSSGIFFPIVESEGKIIQDAAVNLDWFMTKGAMSQSITENNLGHGWIGGLNISSVPANYFDSFIEILSRMKDGGLNISLETDGNNPELLEKILKAKLGHKLHFFINVKAFAENNKSYQDAFEKSLLAMECYARGLKFKYFIDLEVDGQKAELSIFEKIAQCMQSATNNPRLPVFITNKSAIEANIYAYRQAMGQWQINADLNKRPH